MTLDDAFDIMAVGYVVIKAQILTEYGTLVDYAAHSDSKKNYVICYWIVYIYVYWNLCGWIN